MIHVAPRRPAAVPRPRRLRWRAGPCAVAASRRGGPHPARGDDTGPLGRPAGSRRRLQSARAAHRVRPAAPALGGGPARPTPKVIINSEGANTTPSIVAFTDEERLVGQPIPLKPLGRPDGLARYEATFPGCTITLDLMADAAFVAAPGGACTFDDCVVDPTGLWGPNDREITSDREIERARGVAERKLNDARRILQARLRTTPEGRLFLQEQAGFPANRERLCRNYGTSDIGPAFCALKFTEARAENLAARVGGPPSDAPPTRRPARPRPPPQPAPVPQQ